MSNEPNEDESQSKAIEIHDDRIQIRGGALPKNQPIILFIERGKKLTIRTNHLMTSG